MLFPLQSYYRWIVIYFAALVIFLCLQCHHHHLSRLFTDRFLTDDSSESNDIDVICPVQTNSSSIDRIEFSNCFSRNESNESQWSLINEPHQRIYPNLFNSSSLIITVGTHDSSDLENFIRLFNPFLLHYVPLKNRWRALEKRFRHYPKVMIQPYGLSDQTKTFLIERLAEQNADSIEFQHIIEKKSSTVEQIQLFDVVKMMKIIREKRNSFRPIDLLSLQCHGCELEILPALIENDLIGSFRLIQFLNDATVTPKEKCIYCRLEQTLRVTHRSIYFDSRISQGWILNE